MSGRRGQDGVAGAILDIEALDNEAKSVGSAPYGRRSNRKDVLTVKALIEAALDRGRERAQPRSAL